MSISFYEDKDGDGNIKIITKFYRTHYRLISQYKEEHDSLNAEIRRLDEGLKKFELDLFKKQKKLPVVERKYFKINYKSNSVKSNTKQCTESLEKLRVKLKDLDESIQNQKISSQVQISDFKGLEAAIDSQLKSVENNIAHIEAAKKDLEISHNATIESCYQSEGFAKECFTRYLHLWPSVQLWLSHESSNITSINGTSTLEGLIGEWSCYRSIAAYMQDLNDSFDPFNPNNSKVFKPGSEQTYYKQQPLSKLRQFLHQRHNKVTKLSAIITEQAQQLEAIRKAHKTLLTELNFALEEDFSFACLQCENEATSPLGYALAMKAKLIAKQLEKAKLSIDDPSLANANSEIIIPQGHGNFGSSSVVTNATGGPTRPMYVVSGPENNINNIVNHAAFGENAYTASVAQGQSMVEGLTQFESSLLGNKDFYKGLMASESVNNVELTHPKFSYPLAKNSKLVCQKWINKVKSKEDFLTTFANKIINDATYEKLPKLYRYQGIDQSDKLDLYIHRRKQNVMRCLVELKAVMSHSQLLGLNIADICLDKVILSLEKLNALPNQANVVKMTANDDVSVDAISIVASTMPAVATNVDPDAAVNAENVADDELVRSFNNMEKYYAEKEAKANTRNKMRKFLIKDWFAYNELSLQAAVTVKCPHMTSEEVYRDRAIKAIRLLKQRYINVRKNQVEKKAEAAPETKAAPINKKKSLHETAILMETNPENFEFDIFDENGESVSEVASKVENGRLLFQTTSRISGELLNISLFWQSEFERIKLSARSVIRGLVEDYTILLVKSDINELFKDSPLSEADIISKGSNSGKNKGQNTSLGHRILESMRVEKLSASVAYGLTKKSRTLGNKMAFKSLPPLAELSETSDGSVRLLTLRNESKDLISCSFGKSAIKLNHSDKSDH